MTNENNFMISSIPELNSFVENFSEGQPLCVLQLNVQRVSNLSKFHDLVILIGSMNMKPDVLIFTETWILRGTENLYQIAGYKAKHACRETASAGVALYYKDDLHCDLLYSTNDEVSIIHANVYHPEKEDENIMVTAVYMPSSLNYELLCERLNELLPPITGNHVIMGDFNINLFANNQMTTTYVDTFTSLGYSM